MAKAGKKHSAKRRTAKRQLRFEAQAPPRLIDKLQQFEREAAAYWAGMEQITPAMRAEFRTGRHQPETTPGTVTATESADSANITGAVRRVKALPLRAQMRDAILLRRFPPHGAQSVPENMGTADVKKVVAAEWPEECRRRDVAIEDCPRPSWDMINDALGRRAKRPT
jgi:hypothetical protein